MENKICKNSMLVISGLAGLLWILIMLLNVNYEESGSVVWSGFVFGVFAFAVVGYSVIAYQKNTVKGLTIESKAPAYASMAVYLLGAAVMNGVYMLANQEIKLTMVFLTNIGAFLIYGAVMILELRYFIRLSELSKKTIENGAACKVYLNRIYTMSAQTDNENIKKALNELKEVLNYGEKVGTKETQRVEYEFDLMLNEAERMISEGAEEKLLLEKLGALKQLWLMRNRILVSTR